jgi:hypothetical protein|tara:strand:- start:1896 stop:3821 length:1926 start_codon:yes stop_codon:yes gene_type:complete
MPRLTTQAEISNPQRKGYDFRIDNQLYRAAISGDRQMTIQSSDVTEQGVNVKQNPEDFTSNLGRIFSRNNFSGGSNLDTAHRANGTAQDVTRFWDSECVDVFTSDLGKGYNIQLLHTTESKQALSSAVSHMAVVGTRVYVSDDETLYKSDDGGHNWSTVTEGLTAGYQIKGLATHGDLLYITANNGSAGEIETLTSGGTSTQKMSAAAYDKIFSVKGQFLVTIGNAIHAYDGNTTVGSAIITLPSGQTFTDVADVGAVVLATATDGRIYSIKDIAGTFTAKGQTEISGEQPTCIVESQGIIFYGTKDVQITGNKVIGRLYRAALTVADDLYVLSQNQLIKEWDVDDIDNSPNVLFTTRDSVYTGIKESGSTSFLWRYYLPTGGIARYYKAGVGATIQNIKLIDEKFLFTVTSSGVFKQSSNFEEEGYLIAPPADFFTAENKQYVEATAEVEELSSGESVEIHLSNKYEAINDSNDDSWDLESDIRSGTGEEPVQLSRVGRYIAVKVVLKSTTSNTSPKFKAFQVRALARPELVVVQIPVNISDRVERPYRKPIKVKNLGETIYQSLKDKEGQPVTLEVYDPAEVIRGVVENITYPIISNPNIGSVTQYAILTVRGTRQETFSQITTGDVFAVNKYGVMRFG